MSELAEVEAERDAALAVIEQAKAVANAVNVRALPIDGPRGGLAQIRALLSQSPSSALAKLEAERDAALAVIAHAQAALSHDGERDYLERIYATQNALDESLTSALAKVKADALRDVSKKTNAMPADAGKLALWLRAEADRIEKEASSN